MPKSIRFDITVGISICIAASTRIVTAVKTPRKRYFFKDDRIVRNARGGLFLIFRELSFKFPAIVLLPIYNVMCRFNNITSQILTIAHGNIPVLSYFITKCINRLIFDILAYRQITYEKVLLQIQLTKTINFIL